MVGQSPCTGEQEEEFDEEGCIDNSEIVQESQPTHSANGNQSHRAAALLLAQQALLASKAISSWQKKQRGARRHLKAVDVAFNIETDALFFCLYHDSDLKNRDGCHNLSILARRALKS
ncbi:g1774 [Coccomyxa elongata]